MNANPRPFAVVSSTIPPASNGQAVILGRLLRGIPSTDYRLIVTEPPFGKATAPPLDAVSFSIAVPPRSRHTRLPGLRLLATMVDYVRALISRVNGIARITREQQCAKVIACTGHIFDPFAAFLASRRTKTPLIVYAFDYYAYQFDAVEGVLGLVIRICARLFERIVIPRAALVIVPNEFMRDEYARRYGCQLAIVHNPLDSEPTEPSASPWPTVSGTIRLMYTGSVYTPHIQALQTVLKALDQDGAEHIHLSLHTPQSAEELARLNLSGRFDQPGCLDQAGIRAAQAKADILLLPFGFRTPYPAIIKTSAPGKLAEYLASGRPILVHAPADTFLAWYFRQNDCGWVVDQDDPQRLLSAIEEIATNPELRQARCARAWACAVRDFSPENGRQAFLDAISQVPPTPAG